MAVSDRRKDTKLILEIDNGDLTKIDKVVEMWKFKDIQSFVRFTVSLLLETEDKELWIKHKGVPVRVEPADHSIKEICQRR